MSLDNNNFRAAFAYPQPASALHGTSLIKTVNQKISFLSIFNALGNKIGSCLCLHPEPDSKAGWVFTFVLSAIITVLLCIILLPVKLILLGLSCCPCLSKPTTGVEAPEVPSSSRPPIPPAGEAGAFSQPPVGLDPSRFSPDSFIPAPPLSPTSMPSAGGVVSPGMTLREFLQTNYPTVDLNTVTLDSLGIPLLLTLDDLPEGTTLLDLPMSLLFEEGNRDLSQLPLFQSHTADSSPISLTGSLSSLLAPLEEDLEDSQDQGGRTTAPTSLIVDTPAAIPAVEVNQQLSSRELLNSLYPNMDHTRFMNSARVNLRLQGIPGPLSDDDVLNLPAIIAFPDLVAGQPARPTSLTLTDTPASLASVQEEPTAPPPSEELISPSDPRYTFLQNHFPELEPEYYSRHISLLASLSGVDEGSFNLLELPLEAFIYTQPILDYEPIPSEHLQERLGEVSPEEDVRRNNEFIDNLLENTPYRWTFLNRLRSNITNSTQSADLRRQWFSIIDMIVNKSSPELEIEDISNTARAYLFRIHNILKNPEIPTERKSEMLKYIASHYDPNSVAMCLAAMQQEIALQNEITPELASVEAEMGANGVSSSISQILPPLASQATPQEVDGYIQLLKSLLSGPMLTNEDNIHLAPANDIYLESLMRDVPNSWGPIHRPLQNRIRRLLEAEDNRILQQVQNRATQTARLAQNQRIRDNWNSILLALSDGREGSVASDEAQALSRSTMYQVLQLIDNPNIPHDKKFSVISNVASYSDRCPPTWVRVAGQELQAIFNTNDETANIVLVWAQIFKEGLLSEIFRNQREWHMMTAFKIIRGSELGLDNVGIILDPYTTALTGRHYTNQHNQYFAQFLNVYRNSGNNLINSALEQSLGGSEDQIQALTNTILADLTAAGIPEAHRAQIMEEIFFPEENDYKPSREAICYLLLKEGVIMTQDHNQ
ncbi:membrane protein [Chlamydia abortus]|uniref:Membrane protein n=1 Tax=Chlamydia abortus (strain DSM 27085 / S26/3) TaxID=218497 RepID=Q5L578_CHLAB|nr:DUF1539 domain-containing protein [Chlamydia abortus]AUS60255.1 uncharacterized protein CHAB577_0834 [Chlamydia abortus]QRR31525.1 DUF1539 domain-containing protein [Chlamydia abortus]CAH64216.1 putative membrane protein [Chlamydia abortus S26/3]CED80821.1 putative membrane protein [Chlamydia abortus]CED81781.1 putative membrane protein [Chlamydia abortus]